MVKFESTCLKLEKKYNDFCATMGVDGSWVTKIKVLFGCGLKKCQTPNSTAIGQRTKKNLVMTLWPTFRNMWVWKLWLQYFTTLIYWDLHNI
jgi:hypothetical protein